LTGPLLNDDQRRRLATHLRLLVQDLDGLAQSPHLSPPGDAYDAIRALVAQARGAVHDISVALDIPAEHAPSFKRRVAALAEVWAVRMEDLVARRLKGYGAVHPGLAQRLDPGVERLRALLTELARVADRLPDG